MSVVGHTGTVSVTGRFDFGCHHDFQAIVRDTLANPMVQSLRVDMTAATYMDSSALGMLLVAREHANAAGKSVLLSVAEGAVKQILDIANFQKLFVYN